MAACTFTAEQLRCVVRFVDINCQKPPKGYVSLKNPFTTNLVNIDEVIRQSFFKGPHSWDL